MDGQIKSELEPLVEFLSEVAAGAHDVDVLDVHAPALCDPCTATVYLARIRDCVAAGRMLRACGEAYEALRFMAGNSCRCNFPPPGELGVITSRGCRARELLNEPASLEHAGRAFEAAGGISTR